MVRVSQFRSYATQGTERAGVAWHTINRQPSWIVRATIAVFVLVIAIPAIVLMLLAVSAAAVVFTILWFIARVGLAFRRIFPDNEGRENVRVIERR